MDLGGEKHTCDGDIVCRGAIVLERVTGVVAMEVYSCGGNGELGKTEFLPDLADEGTRLLPQPALFIAGHSVAY